MFKGKILKVGTIFAQTHHQKIIISMYKRDQCSIR